MHSQLKIQDTTIYYISNEYESWYVELEEIAIIGEMTNDAGPFEPDFFMVFVKRSFDVMLFPIDSCTQGQAEIWPFLEAHDRDVSGGSLVGCTTFNSEVLWPRELHGKEMFDFGFQKHQTLWRMFWRQFGFYKKYFDKPLLLKEALRTYLNKQCAVGVPSGRRQKYRIPLFDFCRC